MRDNVNIRALAWQNAVLDSYRLRTYAELSALPGETPLEGPAEFVDFKFTVLRRRGGFGGVEIVVEGARLVNGQHVWSMCPAFELLPDGTPARVAEHDARD
jgi:hypothetical protein